MPTDPHLETDPYQRPTFTFANRALRKLWHIVHFLLFRPTPVGFYPWRSFLLRVFGAKIGKANHIYPSAKIWAPWLLETEDIVTIGPGAEIYNPGGVYLAHHTIISQNAYVCTATHDYNKFTFDYITKPILTEPYTWICAYAIVLPGVKFGEGSVLGAGAVASRSLDPWTVHSGNPAREVKKRVPFDTNQPGK